ncbi:MAG TPA: hypothetical protein VEH31_14960 [Streptosporangiaceae bacterium]|nr:hypothetical protein [Streptosporangiaceae bacterium]
MPGSNDRLADTPPGIDQVSPREPDPVMAELRERMERLPPGHPSSPYNDDGSRKPPPPDLSVYELPIPGDPDYQPDAPGASEADHARDDIRNQEPPAANRDPEQELPHDDQKGLGDLDSREQAEGRLSQILDRAMERCRTAEGRDPDGNYGEQGLTPAMCRIELQLEHGHLADQTEEHALKGHARFKEKLAERIERFPNADPNELAAEIHDGVRYTFILDYNYYIEGVDMVQAKLAEAGYDRIETKPGWHGEEYKGVNSQWGDPDAGIRFEVQFHTSESWRAKQITHEAYETIRSNKASVEEAESLRAYQREVSATVRIPPGALDIPAYKKGR